MPTYPTSTSDDGTAKGFGDSVHACPSAMPIVGARRCRDILKESASAAVPSSVTDTTLASSIAAPADDAAATGENQTIALQNDSNTQEEKKSPPSARRSSSSSSRVSFGTIEIHVVEPIPVSESASVASESKQARTLTTPDDAGEEESSSSFTAAKSSRPTSPPNNYYARANEVPLDTSSRHIKPVSQTVQKEQSPGLSSSPTQETATSPPATTASAARTAPKPKTIKCGLEIYERLRPPRRSRTELLLDAVRERSRRKLSHQPLSEDVAEAHRVFGEKHHPESATVAAVDVGHVDNNHCTLRRSDAVLSDPSNLSLEATKNRRSKRLERLRGAAEGEIERSEAGGLRGWSSNFGGGPRL